MKMFALRTIFETRNLLFSTEVGLCTGPDAAYLINMRKLPYSTHETIGRAPDGKQEVQVRCREREYRGQPLLLETVTTCDVQDSAHPLDVRAQLEGRAAQLAAALAWSIPGVVGRRLAAALFFRAPGDPEDSWTWLDVERISVTGCFSEPKALAAQFSTIEHFLQRLDASHRGIALTALRWWRQGWDAAVPADRLVAYWIVLESVASAVASDRYIRRRVEKTLEMVYPSLSSGRACERTSKLAKAIYEARCRIVHEGTRDLSNSPALVAVAEDSATASIRFLLEGRTSANPAADLLAALGI
jgi:hypothetical protein